MDHSGSANGLNWMPTNRHRSSVGAQVCDTRVAYLDFSSRGRGVVALDRSHDRRVPEQPNVHLAGLQFVIDELIVTIDPLLTIEHEAARADRQEVLVCQLRRRLPVVGQFGGVEPLLCPAHALSPIHSPHLVLIARQSSTPEVQAGRLSAKPARWTVAALAPAKSVSRRGWLFRTMTQGEERGDRIASASPRTSE